ncbi:hypothetical protein PG995_004741 [Apiospora arundinis]
MRSGTTYEHLISNGCGSSSYKRREVLKWLCSTFKGMIVPTPPSDRVVLDMPLPDDAEAVRTSFVFLNSYQERQSVFEQQLKDHGRATGGIAAFHGATLHNAFKIICDGVIQHKNPDGNIFYTKEPSVAAFYTWRSLSPEQSQIIGQGWKNSMLKNHTVLFGLEVAKPADFYGVDHEANSRQGTVMVRHIFVLSPAVEQRYRDTYGHDYWVQDQSPRPQMEQTFRRIHDGRLIKEVSKRK